MNEAISYDKAVVHGDQITAKTIKQACRIDLIDRKKQRLKSFPFYFDNQIASEYLNLAKVISSKNLAPFQKWYISIINGWRFKSDKRIRRYNASILSMARKNAKSYLASVIMVSALLKAELNNDLGKQYYIVASKLPQARLTLNQCGLLIKRLQQSSSLARNFKITKDKIYSKVTNSYILALPSRSDSLDGLRVDGAIVDESHSLKTPRLLEVLQSAQGQSPNSIIIQTSTCGFSQSSPFHHDWDVALKELNDRSLTSRNFNAIYTQDSRGEVAKNPKSWVKSNPLLPYVKTMGLYLKDQLNKATINNRLNSTYVKNFNLWGSQNDNNFIGLDKWETNEIKPINPYGRSNVVIGIDLARINDISALTYTFMLSNGKYYSDTFGFIADKNHDINHKSKADGLNYLALEKLNEVHICRHSYGVIDFKEIAQYIEHFISKNHLKNVIIAYDPWQSGDLINMLGDDTNITMVKVSQSRKSLSNVILWLYRLIVSHKLLTKKNLLFRYCINNLIVTVDSNGNPYLDKQKYRNKIDSVFALLDSLYVQKNLKHESNKPSLSEELNNGDFVF